MFTPHIQAARAHLHTAWLAKHARAPSRSLHATPSLSLRMEGNGNEQDITGNVENTNEVDAREGVDGGWDTVEEGGGDEAIT